MEIDRRLSAQKHWWGLFLLVPIRKCRRKWLFLRQSLRSIAMLLGFKVIVSNAMPLKKVLDLRLCLTFIKPHP